MVPSKIKSQKQWSMLCEAKDHLYQLEELFLELGLASSLLGDLIEMRQYIEFRLGHMNYGE